MARVVWADRALLDIEAVYAYIAQFNPLAAARVMLELRAAGNSLETFPARGRLIGRGLRELVSVWPYVIRYRVAGERVVVLRVRHGAQAPG